MPTNARFARAVAMAGLLIAVALTSGCGFFCFAHRHCLTGCCVDFRCINDCAILAKDRTDDAAQAADFTDLLTTLFPPAEWTQY